jgi:hypothetical protein
MIILNLGARRRLGKGRALDGPTPGSPPQKRDNMPGMVLALPIGADQVEAWRRFCQELSGSRLQLYIASRRRLGITCERLALTETAFGAVTVTTLEATDVARVLEQILTSDLPFDRWYREKVMTLHGIQLAGFKRAAVPEPPAPDQELLFEWRLT